MAFSIANKSPTIFLSQTCLYSLTFGIVWAKFTVKLIVKIKNFHHFIKNFHFILNFFALIIIFKIAHMTKGEIFLFDTCLIGPVALLLNQYFSYIIPELIVLVASLVRFVKSFFKL